MSLLNKGIIMAVETYVVFDPASLSSDHGPTVNTDTTREDGFSDAWRVWSNRHHGSKLNLYVNIGSGDTLKLKGKFRSGDAWIDVQTFTASTIAQVSPMPIWVFERTVGDSADSLVVWAL